MKDALMANLLLCLEDSGRCSFNVAIWEEDPDCQDMLRFFNLFCGDLNVQMCLCVCLCLVRSVSVLSACAVAREREKDKNKVGVTGGQAF